MAFVDVLRLLELYGVLESVDGATESFVDSAEAKVLYRVDSTLVLRLIAAPVGPSQLAVPPEEVPLRAAELLTLISHERRYGPPAGEQPDRLRRSPASSATSGCGIRPSAGWSMTPSFTSATPQPTSARISARRRAVSCCAGPPTQGGFILEERADGVLLIDADAIATDTKFPDDASTAKVAALLLLDELGGAPATRVQLEFRAAELLARFPRWAMSYRDAEGTGQAARRRDRGADGVRPGQN